MHRALASMAFCSNPVEDNSVAEKHYEVQAIVNHRGSGKNMEYYVHWRGYDDQAKYNTWEPVSSFDSLKPINDYWARRNVASAVANDTSLPATVNKRKDYSKRKNKRYSSYVTRS